MNEVLFKFKLIARMLPRVLVPIAAACRIGRRCGRPAACSVAYVACDCTPLAEAGRGGWLALCSYVGTGGQPRQASNTENVYYPLPNQVLLTMAKILNHYWEDEFKAYY